MERGLRRQHLCRQRGRRTASCQPSTCARCAVACDRAFGSLNCGHLRVSPHVPSAMSRVVIRSLVATTASTSNPAASSAVTTSSMRSSPRCNSTCHAPCRAGQATEITALAFDDFTDAREALTRTGGQPDAIPRRAAARTAQRRTGPLLRRGHAQSIARRA